MSLPIVQAYIRIRSGTAYVVTKGTTMSSRHLCRMCQIHPHQQRCVYKISPQKSHYFIAYKFARNFRWETFRWNILGVRRTGKYVAATKILNQAFIAKITANPPIYPQNISYYYTYITFQIILNKTLTIIPKHGIINLTGNTDYVCHPHGKNSCYNPENSG